MERDVSFAVSTLGRLTGIDGVSSESPSGSAASSASLTGVERVFRAHIDRLLPELPRYFSRLPAP